VIKPIIQLISTSSLGECFTPGNLIARIAHEVRFSKNDVALLYNSPGFREIIMNDVLSAVSGKEERTQLLSAVLSKVESGFDTPAHDQLQPANTIIPSSWQRKKARKHAGLHGPGAAIRKNV